MLLQDQAYGKLDTWLLEPHWQCSLHDGGPFLAPACRHRYWDSPATSRWLPHTLHTRRTVVTRVRCSWHKTNFKIQPGVGIPTWELRSVHTEKSFSTWVSWEFKSATVLSSFSEHLINKEIFGGITFALSRSLNLIQPQRYTWQALLTKTECKSDLLRCWPHDWDLAGQSLACRSSRGWQYLSLSFPMLFIIMITWRNNWALWLSRCRQDAM